MILTDLGPTASVVVAGGAGYIVDTGKCRITREIGFRLERVRFVPEITAVVTLNGLWCEVFDANRTIWTTPPLFRKWHAQYLSIGHDRPGRCFSNSIQINGVRCGLILPPETFRSAPTTVLTQGLGLFSLGQPDRL